MVKREVSQDTIELLKECDAGCKMAVDSMEQIGKYVTDNQLKTLITKYNGEHIKMEEDIHRMLNAMGEEDQEPNPIAKASSWLQSEVKMMLKGDTHQAASLLTDGCNMGIKSLHEYKNQYKAADEQSKGITRRLVSLEEKMAVDMRGYL